MFIHLQERERDRQRERQTERETDRETERETDRETERETDRHREMSFAPFPTFFLILVMIIFHHIHFAWMRVAALVSVRDLGKVTFRA